MEAQFPLEMGDTLTDEHGETIQEVGKPRVKKRKMERRSNTSGAILLFHGDSKRCECV